MTNEQYKKALENAEKAAAFARERVGGKADIDQRQCDVNVLWFVGWGVECRLRFDAVTGKASLSWSSTGRSVAQALAAVALYREEVELAAMLESLTDI